jgi:uridine phosphorylase
VTDLPVAGKAYDEPSIFQQENLLREARRQRHLPDVPVPAMCLLDPDGDIVRHLAQTGTGRRHPGWACYHTDMWVTTLPGSAATPAREIGVVGRAVGAPFAVLVAEQLHASGARLVASITSAGRLGAAGGSAEPAYFVLIESALRDEGTSVHYLPPSPTADLPVHRRRQLTTAFTDLPEQVVVGRSWTTDAPYRETPTAIAAATDAGAVCVEMEAAALYAYATARGRDVVCLAHVTNTMAVSGDDFEKGDTNGALAALRVTALIAHTLLTAPDPEPRPVDHS